MTPHQAFQLVNLAVLPVWGLLILWPRWHRTQWIARWLMPCVLGGFYLAIVVLQLPDSPGGFGTLDGVAELFANPWILLAGWMHYLAFDLFVGSWIVRDARRRGVRHAFVVPCLVLTFVLGPTGLVAYVTVRALKQQVECMTGDAFSEES